jgi:hypothetical protein
MDYQPGPQPPQSQGSACRQASQRTPTSWAVKRPVGFIRAALVR